jgi:hypothetical protein
MKLPTPEKLRARFAELAADREAVMNATAPLRAERDDLSADTAARVARIDAQIAELTEGLFDADNEAAMIARALGGKTALE